MTHSAAAARTRRTKANGAGILAPLIREHSVFLGGSSMGKGFRRAARYYLRKAAPLKIPDAVLSPSLGDASNLLNPGVEHRVEEPFYVVDIGMVISQLYQWKQYFPRGEWGFVFISINICSFWWCCPSCLCRHIYKPMIAIGQLYFLFESHLVILTYTCAFYFPFISTCTLNS